MSVRNVYVHVDSSNRLKSDRTAASAYTCPTARKRDESRRQSFSLPNTADNLYGEMHKLDGSNTTSTPSSNEHGAEGILHRSQRCQKLHDHGRDCKRNQHPSRRPAKVFAPRRLSTGHKFGNETPLTIQLAYDATTYKISILVSSTLQKVFAIARQGSNSARGNSWALPTRGNSQRTMTFHSRWPSQLHSDSDRRVIVRCPERERDERRLKTDFYAVNGTRSKPEHGRDANPPGTTPLDSTRNSQASTCAQTRLQATGTNRFNKAR